MKESVVSSAAHGGALFFRVPDALLQQIAPFEILMVVSILTGNTVRHCEGRNISKPTLS